MNNSTRVRARWSAAHRAGLALGFSLLASISLPGCGGGGGGGGGSSSSSSGGAALAPTSINVNLRDAATGALLGSGSVTVVLDAGNFYTGSSKTLASTGSAINIPLNTAVLADANDDGLLDSPAQLRLAAQAPGYLSTVTNAVATYVGANSVDVRLIGLTQSTTDVGGVQQTGDLTKGPLAVIAAAGNTRYAQLSLPANLPLVSSTGKLLDDATLKVEMAVLDANSPQALSLLPGGSSADVQNIADYNTAHPTQTAATMDVHFLTAGFTAVELVDGAGNIGSSIGQGQTATVRIGVSPEVVNPNTGKQIAAGDTIPVWSMGDGAGAWRYEADAAVMNDANGALVVDYPTTHFTSFMVAFIVTGIRDCSPQVQLVDSSGQPFLVPSTVTVAPGTGGTGFTFNYTGADSGRIALVNLPNVPMNVTFYRVGLAGSSSSSSSSGGSGSSSSGGSGGPNNSVAAVKLTGPNADTSTAAETDGSLKGVNFCGVDGAKITMTTLANAQPRLSLVAYPSTTPLVRGQQALTFKLALDFAPTSPVTVHYATNDSASNTTHYTPASGSVVFAAGQTSQSFTIAAPGDVDFYAPGYVIVNLSSTDALVQTPTVSGTVNADAFPSFTVASLTVTEPGPAAPGYVSKTVHLSFTDPLPYPLALNLSQAAAATTAQQDVDFYFVPVMNVVPGTSVHLPPGVTILPAGSIGGDLGTVSVLDNKDVETSSDVAFTISTVPGYYYGTYTLSPAESSFDLRINDDGDKTSSTAPTVSIAPALLGIGVAELPAGQTFYERVSLSSAYTQPVTVKVTTTDGTALANRNYLPVSTTLSFAPGEATKVVPIATLVPGIARIPQNETFTLSLSGATNATISGSASVTRTIDNPIPDLHATLVPPYVAKGDTGTINVVSTMPAEYPMGVNFTGSDNPLVQGVPFSVAIPAGSTFGTANFSVADDQLYSLQRLTSMPMVASNSNPYTLKNEATPFFVPASHQPYISIGSAGSCVNVGDSLPYSISFDLDQPVDLSVNVGLWITGGQYVGQQYFQFADNQVVAEGATGAPYSLPADANNDPQAATVTVSILPGPDQAYFVGTGSADGCINPQPGSSSGGSSGGSSGSSSSGSSSGSSSSSSSSSSSGGGSSSGITGAGGGG